MFNNGQMNGTVVSGDGTPIKTLSPHLVERVRSVLSTPLTQRIVLPPAPTAHAAQPLESPAPQSQPQSQQQSQQQLPAGSKGELGEMASLFNYQITLFCYNYVLH